MGVNRYHNAILACMEIIECRKRIEDATRTFKESILISEMDSLYHDKQMSTQCFDGEKLIGKDATIEKCQYIKTELRWGEDFSIALHEDGVEKAKCRVLRELMRECKFKS